jgi:outer membrane protein OmpA-like peptidoglycan-associated protein
MQTLRLTRAVACWAACAGLLGCGAINVEPPKQQPPAPLAVPTAPGETTFVANWPVLEGFAIDEARDRAAKARQQLNVAKDILRRCALVEPRFDFDSAAVNDDDRVEIDRLAGCLTRGPLKDRELKLVGRADYRGAPSYNMLLGQYRAERVKRLLMAQGVPGRRIVATSRGAMTPVGLSPGYTNADDRRVDVLLVD